MSDSRYVFPHIIFPSFSLPFTRFCETLTYCLHDIVGSLHKLNATSTKEALWYIVPAGDKDNARSIVSQVILDALEELKMDYPKTTAKRRHELELIRKQL